LNTGANKVHPWEPSLPLGENFIPGGQLMLLQTGSPGTDVKILGKNIFGENVAFLSQNEATFGKNLIITLVYDINANFVVENRRKL
jgi:hypothetical protein